MGHLLFKLYIHNTMFYRNRTPCIFSGNGKKVQDKILNFFNDP